MKLTAAQVDRACGVVVASAVGDALGAGYEFGSAPYDGSPEMIGGGLGGFAPGEWTDDTAQAVAIAQVAATGVDLRSSAALDAVARRFAEWYAGHPPDVGIQTAAVLRAAGRVPTGEAMAAAARAEHDRSGRSAGNGSLMRTAPVALAYLGEGQEAALVEAAHGVSALTHHDPLAGDGAALWCLMIRQAVLHGDVEFGRHHQLLREPDLWRDRTAEAESREPGVFSENGWVVGAFQAAWSAITHTAVPAGEPGQHLSDALGTAIGVGHDTDTVAAIAGALLGARWGVSAVPLGWQRLLHGWPDLRFADLTALAVRIVGGNAPPERYDYDTWDAHRAFVAHPLVVDLWIGGATALDDLTDRLPGVDAVVSLCRVGTAQVPDGLERIDVRLIDTNDADNPNLDRVIDDAARTTSALLAEGKRVYLHCAAAQSRTPTVATRVAAVAGHPTEDALRAVVTALPAAHPRTFLVDALHRLEAAELSTLPTGYLHGPDYGLHSDEDGDTWLHSDEPESDAWVVTATRGAGGQEILTSSRTGFPALGWRFPRNSWCVDGYDDVRIRRPDGTIARVRTRWTGQR